MSPLSSLPTITSRPFRDELDWWRVRGLLVGTHSIAGPDFNWEIRRWDGGRFHNKETGWTASAQYCDYHLWETADGLLVGAAFPEGGESCLLVHPDYRGQVEAEMVAHCEAHFAAPGPDGKRQVSLTVFAYDALRQRLLERRGYEQQADGWILRQMRLGNPPIPDPAVPDGYTLRPTRPNDLGECERMAALLNAAFGRTFHCAEEYANFVNHSPSFRHDLNLVVEAPDGGFAAHVGFTYDDANHFAIIEPVCTHPGHRRLGLAQALTFEGLRRVKALGARLVEVGTGLEMEANKFYDTVGFSEAYKAYVWTKVI